MKGASTGAGVRGPTIVIWGGAKAYAAWLSRKTGQTYRLLSEAEREYVTRAGSTTPFWWGTSITPKQANYDGSSDPYKGGGSKGEYRNRTMSVDSFKPNPWGLYNVHGNASEWVQDCWNGNYNGAPSDESARITGDCSFRVLRGGAFDLLPWKLRSAYRDRSPANSGVYDPQGADAGGYMSLGFRVGRTLER